VLGIVALDDLGLPDHLLRRIGGSSIRFHPLLTACPAAPVMPAKGPPPAGFIHTRCKRNSHMAGRAITLDFGFLL